MNRMGNLVNIKRGITVMEIVIVVAISSIIMGVGMAMMSRSNTQFKRSTNLVSIQRLMDNIIERIRSDVRSLQRVVPNPNPEQLANNNFDNGYSDTTLSKDPNMISFVVRKFIDTDSEEMDDEEKDYTRITYWFDVENKTLYRYETKDCDKDGKGGETVKSDFHGMKQVLSLNFDPVFVNNEGEIITGDSIEKDKAKFKCLNVAMQLVANEYSSKESDASTLSIACQFYSTCVESELRISGNNNN